MLLNPLNGFGCGRFVKEQSPLTTVDDVVSMPFISTPYER